ncbi:DUF4880 domain-containing protein [Janthinobacterium sp. PSPC3-1]|uniref:DUF4880 domain-containing protein n=1 Tax=Janthinobacterium sp. PSPC3-1 TaxID=2804653 RepID=UPI003CF03DED
MRAAGMNATGLPAPLTPPLSRKIARQAVEWFLIEQSGQATPEDLAASARWRARDPEHLRAWHKVRQVSGQLEHASALLPASVAAPVLRRPQRHRPAPRAVPARWRPAGAQYRQRRRCELYRARAPADVAARRAAGGNAA